MIESIEVLNLKNYGHGPTMWENENFTLTKKSRENSIQCKLALSALISRNFSQIKNSR